MQVVLQQLVDIELRIKDLASKYAALKEENETLLQQKTELSKDLDQHKEEKERLDMALSSALTNVRVTKKNDERQKRMKKEMGQYINEIDKCIHLMQEIW